LDDFAQGNKSISFAGAKRSRFRVEARPIWLAPHDSKPMPAVGAGVEEIRIREESGTYRVIYTARVAEFVYVLHAFQKKTQQTAKRDLNLAHQRFQQIGQIPV
jgi:phage-related protein